MHGSTPMAASLLGLLVVAPVFASPQESDTRGAIGAGSSSDLPPDAVIDEIEFVGLHRVAAEAAKSRISFHSGEEFDAARIAADVRALSWLGWFEDVFVRAEPSDRASAAADGGPPHLRLEFHVREYPFLAGVEFSGSKILSPQQIKKLLEDKGLSPQVGAPANPLRLHRVAVTIQSQLAAMGHPEARARIRQQKLSGERVKVEFQLRDGPRLPVVRVHFAGHPEISDKVLRKHMNELSPDAWFSGLRNKNVYTQEKVEQDRASLLACLQNHGFPQARIGDPEIALVHVFSGGSLRWLQRHPRTGLSVRLPVEAGTFYTFGRPEVSASVRQKLNSPKRGAAISSDIAPGRPFSEHAVEAVRRSWELRLHRSARRQEGVGEYRLRATPTFNGETHMASVRFDFDPTPPYLVGRIEFRGNQRFPDRYLRRRIGLRESQPLDEYTLEAGLARLARTGYFQPFKKEDVQIVTHEVGRMADVTVRLREKGKQRITFSGGREQFGTTVGIAYTVFNLLGLDEFLSTQIDGGPETLQFAFSLAKEGFLGSRGTLALSVFDTFLRPHFTTGVQGPFQRTQSHGASAGWSYAVSDVDAVGINFGLLYSQTESSVNQPGATDLQVTDRRNETSRHSLGIGFTHYAGEQKIQVTDSVSGGWLGGNENLLKSKVEYGRVFPDEIFDHHNAFAFRTTISAVGSYKGDMPPNARFLAGDDLVRGLRPGALGPYQTVATVSPSGAIAYSAVPGGADLIAASNWEYRFPLRGGVEGATFFDAGSGRLLPNWLGPTRPSLLQATNGLLHGATGFELRWTLPAIGVPVRINYSFNVLRLNRAFFMPDGSVVRLHDRAGALGWGLGPLF
jgi:outer membrane protein assembly complex protein YaeT